MTSPQVHFPVLGSLSVWSTQEALDYKVFLGRLRTNHTRCMAAVHLLLEHLRESSLSLNDAIAAIKTNDGYIDREKLETFLGLTPADKGAGEYEADDSRAASLPNPV